jgi:dipeptidase D
LQGGNLHNAIPREASFNFVIPFNQKEELRKNLNLFITTLSEEFPHEPELTISLESHSNDQSDVICQKQSDQLLYALFACPHGVISMSKEIENLPETSTNLASVKMPDNCTLIVSTSQRSSVESKKHEIKDRVEAIFALAGADKITHSDGYPGWKPNLQSKIKKIVVEAFYKLFKEEATVSAIHAGLECGLFYEKNPKLDMISIGPDIFDNHSPSEKCKISSVERFWLHTIEILENIR